MHNFRQCAIGNNNYIEIYASHSRFNLNGENVDSGSEDGDDYDVYATVYSSDEDDTASVDHLSDGEDKVYEVRTRPKDKNPKKRIDNMFDETFLASVYKDLEKEKIVGKVAVGDEEADIDDEDKLGDLWPVHDPIKKWKYPVLGERFEGPDQLKRCMVFYALANGYNLYYKYNDGDRFCVRCCKKP